MVSQFIKLLDYLKLPITTADSNQIQAEVVTYCQPRVNQTGDIWLIKLFLKDFWPVTFWSKLQQCQQAQKEFIFKIVLKVPAQKYRIITIIQYLKYFVNQQLTPPITMLVDETNSYLSPQAPWVAYVKLKNKNTVLCLRDLYQKILSHFQQVGFADLTFHFDTTPSKSKQPQSVKTVITNTNQSKQSTSKAPARVELQVHTKMTVMDGVGDIEEYFSRAEALKISHLAFTDRHNVHAFPQIEKISTRYPTVHPIYGAQLSVVNELQPIVYHPTAKLLSRAKYVFLDLETTGLSARYDAIIEVGLVFVDELSDFLPINNLQKQNFLIKPDQVISAGAEQVSHITADELAQAPPLAEVLPKVLELISDRIVVAHNSPFDWGFLQFSCNQLKLSLPAVCVIDTLMMARALLPQQSRFNLKSLVKFFKIPYDEQRAHRATYDAFLTYQLFLQLIKIAQKEHQITKIKQLSQIKRSNQIIHKNIPFWVTVLCRDQQGLKALYQVISQMHTNPAHRVQITRSELASYRKHLWIGSSGIRNEIIDAALNKSDDELMSLMEFYDYIEIQPPSVYQQLQRDQNFSLPKIQKILANIITLADRIKKKVVVSSAAYHVTDQDQMTRDIFVKTKGLRGQYHYLFRKNNLKEMVPTQHLRTYEELQQEFSFLPATMQKKIILTNPQQLVLALKPVKISKKKLYPPQVPHAQTDIESWVWTAARAKYQFQNKIPTLVEKQIKKELTIIFKRHFEVVFWIARQIAHEALVKGHFFGSRGSVGSSLVATLLKITEVNPLPPHYLCCNPQCCYSDFKITTTVQSGFDLPIKKCPACKKKLQGEGHNIPFSTFLGLTGEKVPDIDLNFAGDYQEQAHNQVRQYFGTNHTFRAGTISTVATRTAFVYTRDYFEKQNIQLRTNNQQLMQQLAEKCTGVKRTTGQHPGGILIIPKNMEVEDFTPVNFPANDYRSNWKTTHLDFEALHDNLLKIDILGHDDPKVLKMLALATNKSPYDISFQDPQVMQLFTSNQPLNIIHQHYLTSTTGVLGIPEFGTSFVRSILREVQPKCFSDLVAICGLSHGTDVWHNNLRPLFLHKKLLFSELFACRDDIFLKLRQFKLTNKDAFRITELVRKGNKLTKKDVTLMQTAGVDPWLITACRKITYLFPKAHAVAYVMMAWRVAWYKINFPYEYYATYLTVSLDTFDLVTVMGGVDDIKAALKQIRASYGQKISVLQKKKRTFYYMVLEMLSRDVVMRGVDLNHSDQKRFLVKTDGQQKYILPPLSAISNLGTAVAESIVVARTQKPIVSLQDLRARTKITINHVASIKKLKIIVDNTPAKNPSLF